MTNAVDDAYAAFFGDDRAAASEGRQAVVTTMIDVQAEPVRWVWERRLVLGMLNVLVGEPGLGKSTLAYHLVAGLSRGELKGDLYGQPADALVVTYEDHLASVVRPRLEAANADLARVHELRVKEPDGSDDLLTLPNDIELISEAIERTHAHLLIVDPIMAAFSGEMNSHNDKDVRRVLAPLSQLAERHDVAVVVVMHVNKSQAKEFFRRVGASIGFTGAARSMLLVARDPDDPDGEQGLRRVLAHGKCNVGPLAPSLLFEIESVQLSDPEHKTSRLKFGGECQTTTADLLGSSDGDDRLGIDDARELLCHELADGRRPEVEIREGALAQGISERTLRRARKQLGIQSIREQFGPGGQWYLELPDDGVQRRPPPHTVDDVATFEEMASLQGKTATAEGSNGQRRPPSEGGRLWPPSAGVRAPLCDHPEDGSWRLATSNYWVCSTCHPPADGLEVVWREP